MLKKRTVSIFFIVFILNILLANTMFAQKAEPPKHEIHVYTDTETNRLYWPEDMPFWVRLATSPEDNAPSFLLEEISSKSKNKSYVSEGIELEISGRQFIRWYNFVTKDSLLLKFYADGDAPKTSISFLDAPKYKGGQKTFYGKGLKTTLQSVDPMSGVETIYYSMDGAAFVPYKSELMMTREKPYNLRYYAVDYVGYAEKLEEIDFTVDTSPPITKHNPINNFIGNVLSPITTFQLTSTDAISGLNKIYYGIDKTDNFNAYKGGDISLKNLEDGNHKFVYYAVDQVENNEQKIVYNFYLDKVAPVADFSIQGDLFKATNGADFVSPRSRIILNATDNKIGVDFIESAINKSQFSRYSTGFPGPYEDGIFTVSYRAVDKLGNMSDTEKFSLRMDLAPPKTSYSFTGPNYAQRGTVWLTSESKIKLATNDIGCGVQKTEYSIDRSETRLYKDPIPVSKEGRYIFRYWSFDNVNNREVDQAIVLFVDNSAPEISESFSIVPIGTADDGKGNMVNIYPRFTSLFVAAMDNSSGIKSIWFKMNGDKEQEFSQTLFFDKEDTYHIQVRTIDQVGNEAKKDFSFIIKD
ncbi:OmpL47-type beta-barrel domain-containing protein [Candidatus Cloacimonadota bacterium]